MAVFPLTHSGLNVKCEPNEREAKLLANWNEFEAKEMYGEHMSSVFGAAAFIVLVAQNFNQNRVKEKQKQKNWFLVKYINFIARNCSYKLTQEANGMKTTKCREQRTEYMR